jgi:hypothetical protein
VWLLVLLVLSTISTLIHLIWRSKSVKYRFDRLALISWGSTIMFTIDAVYAYLEGEEPIEISVNAALLSITLVIVVIILWSLSLILSRKP